MLTGATSAAGGAGAGAGAGASSAMGSGPGGASMDWLGSERPAVAQVDGRKEGRKEEGGCCFCLRLLSAEWFAWGLGMLVLLTGRAAARLLRRFPQLCLAISLMTRRLLNSISRWLFLPLNIKGSAANSWFERLLNIECWTLAVRGPLLGLPKLYRY